jgi:hypothetical protein
MKNKIRIALVLVAMMAFTLEARSETSFGVPDCGQWISQPTPWQKSWLLGFLTGTNVLWNVTNQIPHDPLDALSSAEQAYVWMDNYCRKNPLEKVMRGGWELFFELVKKKRESQ